MFQRRSATTPPTADGAVRDFEVVRVRPTISLIENAVESGEAQMVVPLRKRTQGDQNNADGEARRRAMRDLVQSWMDRLQLISVITTFFASIEAGLLQIMTPATKNVSGMDQAANASIVGALIMHTFAAIVSFLAAFFLVRYKLKEAKKEELKLERHDAIHAESPDVEKGSISSAKIRAELPPSNAPLKRTTASEPPIWSSDPHLEQVGPFRRKPPTHLLGLCHSLCISLAAAGFFLALAGIMFLVWAKQPLGVAIFASLCMASCILGCGTILMAD